MMKRHQHITKQQSELIQEKKFIDVKLHEAIAKHCYLEKTKYELLPQVVIPTIASHVTWTKVDKIPDTTLNTAPITPPNTPSKPIIHNIMSKRSLSDTEKANVKRIWKDVVIYNFHDEIDGTQLLTADLNQPWTLLWTHRMLHNICDMHLFNDICQWCTVVLFWEWKY